jgi:hypothetical protein
MGAEQSHPVNFEVGAYKVDENNDPYFQMGPDTLRVPMELHKEARENLGRAVREAAEDYTVNSYLYFQGGRNNRRFDTDINYVIFRQVRMLHDKLVSPLSAEAIHFQLWG